MFLSAGTQWHYAGEHAMPVRLDHAAVEAAMRMLSIPEERRPGVFHGVRIMEDAALPALQENVKKAIERANRRNRRNRGRGRR